MESFNEVFARILKAYDETGSMDAAISAANLSEEQMARAAKAFEYLDAFDANYASLQEAKAQGISRKNWLAKNIIETAQAKGADDEKIEEVFELLAGSVTLKDEEGE